MTPHFSNEAFAALGGPNLVYVRAIKARDIIGDEPMRDGDGLSLDPDQILYALHRADGERLAVMADRNSALAAAIAHDMTPVTVH